MTRFRVSSKHLTLVSPVFKAMLQGDRFKEGNELARTGRVEVPLFDDNIDALRIILDILHHRYNLVPPRIDSQILMDIAAVVDKYQLKHVLDLPFQQWRPHFHIPTTICDDVASWISIS